MKKSKADTVETRKRIVSVASHMFLRQGLGATGIADIMVASGLTQGGFYRHFESKEQLIAEANEAAFRELLTMFDAATAGMPPRDALELIIHRYLHQLQAEKVIYMCPLANLSSELCHADLQVKAVAADGYASLVKMIASHLMRMDVADYVGVAEAILANLVGAVSLARMSINPAAGKSILASSKITVDLMIQNAPTSKSLRKSAH